MAACVGVDLGQWQTGTVGFQKEPFQMTLVIARKAATLVGHSASMGIYADVVPQNGRGHAQVLRTADGVGIGRSRAGAVQ